MSKSIKVEKLVFSYDENKILNNINLEFIEGNIITIIGPNGSGKSTLLKNIASTLTPQEGTIFIDNKELRKYSQKELARQVAVVPQNTNIEYDFTAYDIVLMGRNPYIKRFQMESEEDISIVEEVMKKTNTWDLRDRNINELSGGECQRVVIARALAQQPKIILLDEPTAALDMHHQIEILDLLKVLNKQKKLTVIIALHDINLAARYSSKILLLNEGNQVIMGNPEDVITKKNLQLAYKINMIVDKNKYTNSLQVIPLSNLNI